MQQKASKTFTYQTRLSVTKDQDELLGDCAQLFSTIERHLFKEFCQGKKLSDLKSPYLVRFGITARQFNSLRIQLEGKIASYKIGSAERISLLKIKVLKLSKHVKKIKDPFKKHNKQRRLCCLQEKLQHLQKDQKENKVRLCFGGKKLFHQQFHLEENGFEDVASWKKAFTETRNNSFFIVGSKDESCGNQTCQFIYKNGFFTLILRLPNSFVQKFLIIENITFAYGQEEILSALEENALRKEARTHKDDYASLGKAINFRLINDKKGWAVFVSIEKTKPLIQNKKKTGSIGIDINANHLAAVETDKSGNIIGKRIFACVTYGKTKNQRAAIIGDIAKEIVAWARKVKKPIVLEELDFQRKKQSLREQSKKQSRLLSSFAYKQIYQGIESKAYKEGIEVYTVNPAYTSIIGGVKFEKRYGLSRHEAAALVIARRKEFFSEKPNRTFFINSGSAFSLPARNREKHVP